MDLPDNMFGFAVIPRTALRPNQQPYFATDSILVGPKSYYTFLIEDGFAIGEPWVPLGKRFSIWYCAFTIPQNSLIRTAIGVQTAENPGEVTWLALQWGYGRTEYLSGIFFDFEQNTRPVYYVANYSDNAVVVDFFVFGVVEVII